MTTWHEAAEEGKLGRPFKYEIFPWAEWTAVRQTVWLWRHSLDIFKNSVS